MMNSFSISLVRLSILRIHLLGYTFSKEKESIIQIACGSIHTLARSNSQRIFSCGNGSTFALGHKNRESCSTFKQIEFFNGAEEGV